MTNPFSSIRRIVFLIVVAPATAVAVAVAMQATDYQHYTPEPGSVRTVVEGGWNR
jgi:hypothetical protein